MQLGNPWPFELTYYYPHFLAGIFVVTLLLTKVPAKGMFFLRAVLALTIATVLAHVNRLFLL